MSQEEEPKESVGEKLARGYGRSVELAVLALVTEDDPAKSLAQALKLRAVLAEITSYADELQRVAVESVLSLHEKAGLQ